MRPLLIRVGLLMALFVPQMGWAETCTALAQSVVFGSYNPQSASPRDSTGTVTVTCVVGISLLDSAAYDIKLSAGNSGSYVARQLNLVSSSLNYNLYVDSARTQVWGNGTGGTSYRSDAYSCLLGCTEIRNYTVYGRIPAQQNIAAGAYTDVIIVTVTY